MFVDLFHMQLGFTRNLQPLSPHLCFLSFFFHISLKKLPPCRKITKHSTPQCAGQEMLQTLCKKMFFEMDIE